MRAAGGGAPAMRQAPSRRAPRDVESVRSQSKKYEVRIAGEPQ